MKRAIFISFSVLFMIHSSQAAQSLSTKINSPYTSFRAMGMGDAFTAVADDYSLIYYNPAGFAHKKNNEVQISLLGAGVSAKTQTLVNDMKTASDKKGTDQEKAQAISDVLEQYYGKSLGGKVQALEMFWIRKNWGISLIPVDLTVDMTIDRQLGPAIDLNVKGDTVLAYGYGTELSKLWSAGVTMKYVHRVSVEQSVSALELAADSNVLSSKRFKEGQALDFDIGFLWTPDWFNSNLNDLKAETTQSTAQNEKNLKQKRRSPALAEKNPETEASLKVKQEEAQAGDIAQKNEPTSAVKDQADSSKEAAAKAPLVDEKKPSEGDKVDATAAKDQKEKADVKDDKQEKVAEKTETKPQTKERYPLTLGAVMHNVLGGSFSKTHWVNKDATEAPSKMNRVIDLGSQYQLMQVGDLTIRSMLDLKNLMHPEANTFNKVFHAGIELDYSPSGWFKSQLRAGINQMYYTAGATLLLGVLNIDFATYGEEVGTPSQKVENRVYMAKVGMNF